MTIDLPHMLVTGALVLGVLTALKYSGLLHGASKLKKTLITFVCLFVVLLVLNLIWPYGTGVG